MAGIFPCMSALTRQATDLSIISDGYAPEPPNLVNDFSVINLVALIEGREAARIAHKVRVCHD